ncbi:MAG: hypothetical protein OIF56_07105 [Cohaesibacter sp.]|nr:hypothetical protein [Cohaesibacter sp.]MCV6600367.1 hypothetical protein [Cohaesibacter sp.]
MLCQPRKQSLAAFCLIALFWLPSSGQATSSVTTERIISLPTYSTSSKDAPASLSGEIQDSAGSGTSLNGDQLLSQEPEGAEGQIALPPSNNEAPAVSSFNIPLPDIHYDITKAPKGVQRMHESLLNAAKSGDMAKMRQAIEMNEMPPILGYEDAGSDPLAALYGMSGDSEGSEILAIMSEILESGYVIQNKGTPQELYLWPYFADYPLAQLTQSQRVELFRLITAGDYAEMQTLGHYIFYRLGIGPDGTWHYLTAGD